MEPTPLIALQNLTKVFKGAGGEIVALKDIDLTIQQIFSNHLTIIKL